MKLHRFFSPEKIVQETVKIESLLGSSLTYTDVSGQWKKVLRLSRGERVILFDGSGYDFLCEIQDYQGEAVILKVIQLNRNNIRAVRETVLYVALVKKDTFEWIAQKATELGVSDIIPVIADRSEKKNINIERLQKIIIEASEQSGRGDVPHLHEVIPLKDIVPTGRAIAFDPLGKKFTENDLPAESSEKVALFIGPEGGWTSDELEAFEKASVLVRSLGPQVLRTETAVVAALSHLVF